MKKLLYISFIISVIISITSCETDIDVNAEYKDITVVYGLISPNDTNHYIKINKAFLGDESALNLAANEDNFNYDSDELSVVVEEYNSQGGQVATHSVTRTINEIPKDEGIFDNSNNVLYRFTASNIDRENKFRLTIYNSSLDKEIVGETEIVKEIVVSNPPNANGKFQFWIGDPSTGQATDKAIGVTTGADIGRIQTILVFNYIDHYKTASGLPSVPRSIEMSLGELKATDISGGEPLEWELKGATFFENIVSAVPAKSTIPDLSHRELDNISLKFNVAGTELSTYMDVEAPSNSVNQEKPNYTNLTNGLGIFSSRDLVIWESTIDPQTQNQVNIQNATIKYLASLNLGFCFGTTGTGFPVSPCVQQ